MLKTVLLVIATPANNLADSKEPLYSHIFSILRKWTSNIHNIMPKAQTHAEQKSKEKIDPIHKPICNCKTHSD